MKTVFEPVHILSIPWFQMICSAELFILTAAGVCTCVVVFKVSPYFIIVKIIFSDPLRSMSSFWIVSNIQLTDMPEVV